MDARKRKLNTALFIAYSALMLWLLFNRSGYQPGIPYWSQLKWNLIPFETIALFLRLLVSPGGSLRVHAIINLFGNVIMFIPLGFFLPRVFPKLAKLSRTLLVAALSITLVEILQLFTLLGSCDTDDLMLNLLGAAIGYGFFKLLQR